MKPALALAAVLLALPLFAGGPEDRPTPEPTPEVKGEWPQEGTAAYLPIALPAFVQLSLPLNGPPVSIARDGLPACSRVTLIKIRRVSGLIETIDENSIRREFRGPWTQYLYRTVEECRQSKIAAPLLRSGGGLFIIPAKDDGH